VLASLPLLVVLCDFAQQVLVLLQRFVFILLNFLLFLLQLLLHLGGLRFSVVGFLLELVLLLRQELSDGEVDLLFSLDLLSEPVDFLLKSGLLLLVESVLA